MLLELGQVGTETRRDRAGRARRGAGRHTDSGGADHAREPRCSSPLGVFHDAGSKAGQQRVCAVGEVVRGYRAKGAGGGIFSRCEEVYAPSGSLLDGTGARSDRCGLPSGFLPLAGPDRWLLLEQWAGTWAGTWAGRGAGRRLRCGAGMGRVALSGSHRKRGPSPPWHHLFPPYPLRSLCLYPLHFIKTAPPHIPPGRASPLVQLPPGTRTLQLHTGIRILVSSSSLLPRKDFF